MKTINVLGKKVKVYESERKDKKFKSFIDDKVIHFGARGYTISPGTKKGDNYCARSLGIKDLPGITANDLSRAMWRCKGARSIK